MMTLIGSLLGFIGSAFPFAMKVWQDKIDKAHELAMMQLQLKNSENKASAHLQEIQIKSDLEELKILYKPQKSGIYWVDALNGTVRPVITYAFFALYVAVKVMAWLAIPSYYPTFALYEVLWTGEDAALLSGIISFYFGQRALQKGR